jgi:IS5 family transposase
MQMTFFQSDAGKHTRRQKFFQELESVLPIDSWLRLIAPYYDSKAKTGRPKKQLEILIRTYLVKKFYSLSYEKVEDELYENVTIRNFCGVSNDSEIPDATSIFRFETMLTENDLQEKMFEDQVDALVVSGKIIKKGTIVDSTIIDAPTSTKNQDKKRDPEAGWTKKAGKYRHGFKGHTGVDDESGLIHSAKMTAANVHDTEAVEDCLHGDEERMEGDSGYLGVENHSEKAKKIKRHILKRPSSIKKMSPRKQELERRRAQAIASKRAKVEHVYATVKNIFGWKYTRVRGLEKNAANFFMLCTLTNLYKLSRSKPQTV